MAISSQTLADNDLFEDIYSCRPVILGAPLATRASNASNRPLMSRMMPTSVNGIPTMSKRGRVEAKLSSAQGPSPMPPVIVLVMAPKRTSSKPRVIAAQWQRSKQARTTFGSDEDSQPGPALPDQEGPRTLRSTRMISWVLPSSSHSDTTLLTKTRLSSGLSLLRHSAAKLAKLKS